MVWTNGLGWRGGIGWGLKWDFRNIEQSGNVPLTDHQQ